MLQVAHEMVSTLRSVYIERVKGRQAEPDKYLRHRPAMANRPTVPQTLRDRAGLDTVNPSQTNQSPDPFGRTLTTR